MRIRGVLFDFDGTLTVPGSIDFRAIKQEMECPQDLAILEFIRTQPEHRRGELFGILEEFELSAAENSRPNRFASQCLSILIQHGCLLGIHTRNSRRSVQRALSNFEEISIDDFSAVITRDDAAPKPSPEGVFRAATQMGVVPERMVSVGDYRFDIMAGHAAGLTTVLLTNGGASLMEQGDPAPDHEVSDLEEFLKLVESLQ